MRRAAAAVLALCLAAQSALAQGYEERRRRLIEKTARVADDRLGYGHIAARLWLREGVPAAERRLRELLEGDISGDMFWMFPMTAISYLDRGQLSDATRALIQRSWKRYYPFRGDTENHWLLYYTSMYLMAQKWPELGGEAWFNGKSSKENMEEARRWIEGWVRLTTTRGQGEYDCTHYIGVYLLPLSYLAAWAEDPRIRKQASMMIEWVTADFAAESLDGIYVGAHARTDDRQVVEKAAGVSSDFAWLLFGQGRETPPYGGYAVFYAMADGPEPPEILRRIATDRSRPYTHFEKKRTRNRWRFHDELHGPVYKTTYMTKDYAVSSDQGGVLQPVQQHSWDVTWRLDHPEGRHNTLFSLHPYSGMTELEAYFTFSPDFGTEAVYRSKVTYDSPDKLLGGSPYERIAQSEDAVVALYDIPAGTRFPHINGFFSKDLEEFEEDSSGWILCRGGRAWIAYRPLAPYVWKPIEGGGRRLFSPYLKNGTVVQAASADEFPTLEAFRKAIRALKLEFRLEPKPRVTFRTLRGRTLEFAYGETPRIDGRPLDYAGWPAFGGPFLNAKAGEPRLVMTHGGVRRILDFRTLTVLEEKIPAPKQAGRTQGD
ncbi:MAG: hypothetical protein NZR01_13720 [Bryobacteraceae bacterium]|nr:hypothetical protein [Bryobacteraceae bacterium]